MCRGNGELERDILVPVKTKIARIDITIWSDDYKKKHYKTGFEDIHVRYSTDCDFGSGNREAHQGVHRTKEDAEKQLRNMKE